MVDPREERLEDAGATLEHVDEVDAAGPGTIAAALHRDERRHWMRLVRKEQVVVGGDEVEDDSCDDCRHERTERQLRQQRCGHQNNALCRPPSTTIGWPEM